MLNLIKETLQGVEYAIAYKDENKEYMFSNMKKISDNSWDFTFTSNLADAVKFRPLSWMRFFLINFIGKAEGLPKGTLYFKRLMGFKINISGKFEGTLK